MQANNNVACRALHTTSLACIRASAPLFFTVGKACIVESMYSRETRPSHRNPGTHRTCILKLKGCIRNECHMQTDDEMEDSRDHGTQGATQPSQRRRQDSRPRPSRRHDCNSATTSQIANQKRKERDLPILAEHFPFSTKTRSWLYLNPR